MSKNLRIYPSFTEECDLISKGCVPVAGLDESGRGALAGPVVAAAVVFDRQCTPNGIKDSKLLTRTQREDLFRKIKNQAAVGVGVADVVEIDDLNILQATFAAMTRAYDQLNPLPSVALVDGNRSPKLSCTVRTVIGGDGLSLSIADASIVAKVTRDNLMRDLAGTYPGYGWERIVGYATSEHLAALALRGVTPHHRRTFAPVARALKSKG